MAYCANRHKRRKVEIMWLTVRDDVMQPSLAISSILLVVIYMSSKKKNVGDRNTPIGSPFTVNYATDIQDQPYNTC